MAAARHCSSWADLPPELVGLVRRRLPSLADRVRLAAVCRPWRHGARLEPAVPPPFPWLNLRDGTFLSIPDGEIHRLMPSVPADNSRCISSVGSWLFLEQEQHAGCSLLSLMNPFSKDKDVVQLPDAETIWRGPFDGYRYGSLGILLSAMDLSPDSLFAVLIADHKHGSVVSICEPASTASPFHAPDHEGLWDVALVDGKLYALSPRKLFVLDLEVESSGGGGNNSKPKISSSMKCIADDVIRQTTIASNEKHLCEYFSYLAESSGKLLHVRRLVGCLFVSPWEDQTKLCRTFSFDVFEVDLTISPVQWRRLNSLDGKALFIGPYSKALRASEYGQADCIYFMSDYGFGDPADPFRDPLRDSGVFNMRNGTITPLLQKTMVMQQAPQADIAKGRPTDKFYSAGPSWFFPS